MLFYIPIDEYYLNFRLSDQLFILSTLMTEVF